MDTKCGYCREPFDFDSIQEFDQDDYPGAKKDFFAGRGCPACHWGKDDDRKIEGERAEVMAMLSDVLGDDEDGIAAMMEDYDFLFDE